MKGICLLDCRPILFGAVGFAECNVVWCETAAVTVDYSNDVNCIKPIFISCELIIMITYLGYYHVLIWIELDGWVQ